jgi:mRNA-degrading endonuclease RelE of RelBE toxin-antitoxin system
MKLKQTPTFQRSYKKLNKRDKAILDAAIKEIIADPAIGRFKKGDLPDHQVHKVKDKNKQWLIAYVYSTGLLELVDFGSHQNFYRDLKR